MENEKSRENERKFFNDLKDFDKKTAKSWKNQAKKKDESGISKGFTEIINDCDVNEMIFINNYSIQIFYMY